jgi:ABC-type transporter Mla subunit MlaD
MSILKSRGLTRDETTFEIDMRNLLRSKKSTASNETEDASVEVSSLVSQISGQSVREIDHLIEGLQGVRKRLDDEGGRIQRDIGQYATFSQSIIELTKIVSDGMTLIKAPQKVSEAKDVASPSVSLAD